MLTTMFKDRQAASPPDLQSRLMGRLFGAPQAPSPSGGDLLNGLAARTSPTGLPIHVPPPAPAPVAPQGGRMAATYSAADSMGRPVASGQAPVNAPTAASAPTFTDPQAGALYHDNVDWGPGVTNPWTKRILGPHKQGAIADAYGDLANEWEHQPPIDYSGQAQIASYYDAARKRQEALDAAMGRSGGGVAAAGQASLFGREGGDIGNYVRALTMQRQQQREQELNQLRAFANQIRLLELQRNWAKQDSPSFLQSLLGTVGSVGGSLLGSLNPMSFLSHDPSNAGYVASTGEGGVDDSWLYR